MKTFQGIAGFGAVTLLLVSCAHTSDSNVSKVPAAKPFTKPPLVAANPSVPSPTAAVVPKQLVPLTQPATLPIAKGRIDPFRAVELPPIKQPVPAQTAPTTTIGPNQRQSVKPQATKPQPDKVQPSKPQGTKLPPTKLPSTNPQLEQPQPGLIQLPQPQALPTNELARAIEVNGVMQAGGRVSAIVKEPGATVSRSVGEGEYLAKGAVLVKRIQLRNNQEPLVILEQNGIEVVKSVNSNIGSVASVE